MTTETIMRRETFVRAFLKAEAIEAAEELVRVDEFTAAGRMIQIGITFDSKTLSALEVLDMVEDLLVHAQRALVNKDSAGFVLRWQRSMHRLKREYVVPFPDEANA